MATQRPKRNNSPINSKHQPLKATVPLSSLVRNTSPTRRRTSPSSPVLPPDKRNRLRRSPDVPSNEHRALLSPLGSKVHLFKPVKKGTKGQKHIRRTNSLETLSSSYMNGQWPRENIAASSAVTLLTKSTQTPSCWEEGVLEESSIPTYLDQRKSSSISNTTDSKEIQIFRQHLQRTKQQSSQPFHGKQSPVQGDHSAVSQLYSPSSYVSSKPVSIPQVPSSPKNPSLHTRRSVEGLNIELEGLDLESKDDYVFARTPPEGHRPPVPRVITTNVDMHTQTSNGWIDCSSSLSPGSTRDERSQSTSPSWPLSPDDYQNTEKEPTTPNRSLSADSTVSAERGSPATPSLTPKYASSPKPNNSFWFARGPPDGAEKIPLNIEDIESDAKDDCNCYSCPDTSKVTIQFSKDSPFYSLPTCYECK